MGRVDRWMWMSLERVEWACQVLPGLSDSHPIIRFPMTKYLFHDLTICLLPGGVDWEWGLPSNPQGGSSWS